MRLTPNERARQWLIVYDSEHEWAQYPDSADFVGALLDNLADFCGDDGAHEGINIVRAAWTKLQDEKEPL